MPELALDASVDEAMAAILFTGRMHGAHLIDRFMHDLDALKAFLAGGSSDPVVDRVAHACAICWATWRATQKLNLERMNGKTPLGILDHLDRKQDKSLRQYVYTLKALALVRNLTPAAFAKSLSLLDHDHDD